MQGSRSDISIFPICGNHRIIGNLGVKKTFLAWPRERLGFEVCARQCPTACRRLTVTVRRNESAGWAGGPGRQVGSHCPSLRRRRSCEAAPSGDSESAATSWLHNRWKGKVWYIARFRGGLHPASRASGRGLAGLGKPKLLLIILE
jgi:hypothetical protein